MGPRTNIVAEKAVVKEDEWNFFAFAYSPKSKKGIIQIGDSYGYNDESLSGGDPPGDFPVRTCWFEKNALLLISLIFVLRGKSSNLMTKAGLGTPTLPSCKLEVVKN